MTPATPHPYHVDPQQDSGVDLREVAAALSARWRLLVITPLVVGALALGLTFLVKPTFTAQTTFLPPQQQQSSALSALSSLGALGGLAGGLGAMKSPGDQYVSLMRSVNVEDRIIDRFSLLKVYDAEYRFVARKQLEKDVRIELGKKDGIISVEVDADTPVLAAAIANQYVVELRRLSAELALTEAQQRRMFFENQLKNTKVKLTEAQQVLQNSGFNAGALKAEPRAAAEGYAKLQAEATASEVRLQTLRRSLADSSPAVEQQVTELQALRDQLTKLEASANAPGDADYVSRYREFKYQETLYDLFSKQYEMARLDESREGALIQVVDIATPPERKSKPKRVAIAIAAALAALVLLVPGILMRRFWLSPRPTPRTDHDVHSSGASTR